MSRVTLGTYISCQFPGTIQLSIAACLRIYSKCMHVQCVDKSVCKTTDIKFAKNSRTIHARCACEISHDPLSVCTVPSSRLAVPIKRVAFDPSKLSRHSFLRTVRHSHHSLPHQYVPQSCGGRDPRCILSGEHRYTACTFSQYYSSRVLVVLHLTRTALRRVCRSAVSTQQCVHSTAIERTVSTNTGVMATIYCGPIDDYHHCTHHNYRVLPARNHCQSSRTVWSPAHRTTAPGLSAAQYRDARASLSTTSRRAELPLRSAVATDR